MRKDRCHTSRTSAILSAGTPDTSQSGMERNSGTKGLKRMATRRRVNSLSARQCGPFALAPLLMLLAGVLGGGAALRAQTRAATEKQAPAVKQVTFSTPDAAMQALVQAATAKDRDALHKIFGPDFTQLLSGDAVEDDNDLEKFSKGVERSAELQKDNDTKYTLLIGDKHWPFPVPIIKQGDQWLFNTKDGLEEILNRRIGENELSAIATCRAYVVAQWEYFTADDWDHDGVAAYAQKFISAPGMHDGLYWETSEDESPSPLGSLVAEARAEGYGPKGQRRPAQAGSKAPHAPYHGYYFKILTRQGLHAPGGKYNYIINGNMIAGFALVAYPAKWGNSGVMTFIVNQQGRVYEKNLGPNTDKIASAMIGYDPDPSWKLVDWRLGEQ
jgi:Protein of unknown function (DUF2950)